MFIAQRVMCAQSKSGIAAKYFRIVWLTSEATSGSRAAIAQAIFSNSLGGSQIAAFTPFASSSSGSSYTETKAFDGLSTTMWLCSSSSSLPQHLGVEYSIAQTPIYLRLESYIGINTTRAPTTFRVEYSSDGAAYTTLYTSPTQAAWGANETRDFAIQ